MPLHDAVVHQLLDVVDQAVELPLRVDLVPTAQREPVQAFVVPDVAEHRLDGGEPPAIAVTTLRAVDLALHALCCGFGGVGNFAPQERDLSSRGLVRIAQALRAKWTLLAQCV